MDKTEFIMRLKEDWKANLIVFLITMGLSTLGFLLYFLIKGPQNAYGASNGLLISFCISLAFLVFYALNRWGMFDMFGYGCSYLFGMFRVHPKKKYHDLIEYRDVKYEKRTKSSYYVPFLACVIITGIALAVVYIIYKATFIA